MSSRYSTNGASGQVSAMRNMDVRRLWEKLHTSDFRDNCFAYYREATFEKPEAPRHGVRPPMTRGTGRSRMSFLMRMSVNSTEARVIAALSAILGLGIGVTRLLATTSQSSSVDRVEAYMDTVREDWSKYQSRIQDPKR